uniref:Related to Cytochrome P450 n=1 Tax=Melanopsichium pennsylvanicum 4 TaxID=1398559 RepID=A0A077R097_9BASI|nr:related to Cytochrome P450 [Melanopsichium pennsylvanicum 4]
MTLPPLSTQINVMVGLALASHFVFARFEPRLPESCLVYILVCIAYTCVQATSYHASLPDSIKTVLILSTTYNIVLGSSVATYRAFFHRASKFKGPLALTVSKLAWILTERAGKRPDKLDRLHDEYGDVVRIGPREISIRDPNALPAIYGVNLLPKGPWYNAIEPNCSPRSMSLLSAVDVAERKARRRVWDNAFSLKAIQSYHAFVDQSISATMVKLEALADAKSSVDVDMWTSLCTFDIAGQIGFSKSFGAVHKGAYPEPIQVMHQVTSLTSLIGCISWIAHLLVYLPSPVSPHIFRTATRQLQQLTNKFWNAA